MPSLLVVASHFFPNTFVAAFRASAFASGLADRGWDVGVITPRRSSDDEDTDHGGPDSNVSTRYVGGPPSFGPRGAGGVTDQVRRLADRLATSLSVPDRSIRVWEELRTEILQRASVLDPDVVMTTSPPHSIHSVGTFLKRELSIPWVADFRDPLTGDPRFVTLAAQKLTPGRVRAFERGIYDHADAVVHALPAYHERLSGTYPRTRSVLIPNGVPDDHADVLDHTGTEPIPGRVVLVGRVEPRPMLLVADGVARGRAARPELHLEILADVGPPIRARVRDLLGDHVDLPGHVSHAEALRAMRRADILVKALTEERGRAGGLTSTLYEMLATDRPVVVVNPRSEDRALLADASGASMLNSPSGDDIAAVLCSISGKPGRTIEEAGRFRRTNRRSVGVARADRLLRAVIETSTET